MSPDITQMLVDGQTEIFKAINELKKELSEVRIQRNEIEHLIKTSDKHAATLEDHEVRLSKIYISCITNHQVDDRREVRRDDVSNSEKSLKTPWGEKPLYLRCVDTAVITLVAGGVCLFVTVLFFTVYTNIQNYFDFNHTQISAEKGVKK